MVDRDISATLQVQVQRAVETGSCLRIRGGGTKDFYGREPRGEPLESSGHRGILSYEPTELVVKARGGTPLGDLVAALDEYGQILPFEPPRFAPGGTIGGAVASGLAGPRRPWGGAPRDLLLGVRLLDGRGQLLEFGGQVMKNVAGYDLSRLMAGAMGALGLLLEVSIKVLPRPREEWTLVREASAAEALRLMIDLQNRPVPLSGACHLDGLLHLRFAGREDSARRLAGELGADIGQGAEFWQELRDHRLGFFGEERPLWRLSVPPAWDGEGLEGELLIDWGGAQRWLKSDLPAARIRTLAGAVSGHATLFRNGDRAGDVFHPLTPSVELLHKRLKRVFDPGNVLNPGRLYPFL